MKSRVIAAAAALISAVVLASTVVAPAQAASGSISGYVYGPDGTTPLVDAGVVVGPWTATTDATGHYTIATATGALSTMTVKAYGPWDSGLAPSYYPNTQYVSQATQIDLGVVNSNVNITLQPQAIVRGNVEFAAQGYSTSFYVESFLWDPVMGTWDKWSTAVADKDSGDYEVTDLAPGQYLLRFAEYPDDALRPPAYTDEYFDDVIHEFDAQLVTVTAGQVVEDVDAVMDEFAPLAYRISGADRFATAAGMASFWQGDADVVFIASGLNFPDALGAAPIAGLAGAPLLLVTPTSIPQATRDALADLDPSQIVVVGGTATVSNSVLAELGSYADDVDRISGPDRFATSRELARFGFGASGTKTAYIASGLNFPDALAAGPVAALAGGPVILVNGSATTVDAATITMLDELGVTDIRIAGGPSAVSSGIEAQLSALPGVGVTRYAGANRYETSVELNSAFSNLPLHPREMFVATGANFPDALAAAAAAAYLGVPLFTASKDCVDYRVAMSAIQWRIDSVFGAGGPVALGDGAIVLQGCS